MKPEWKRGDGERGAFDVRKIDRRLIVSTWDKGNPVKEEI